MLDVRYSSKFKHDFKLCVKRGWDMELLKDVIDTLRIPASLPAKNRNHSLSGNYAGYSECHIAPDWLLIYAVSGNELLLSRTGSHSDLMRI